MKKFFLVTLIIFNTTAMCIAQLSLNFDNYVSATNNDFNNNFEFINKLSQIQTGGITGGCLEYDNASFGTLLAYSIPKFTWPNSNVIEGSMYFKMDFTSLSGSATYSFNFSFCPPDPINGGYSTTDNIGIQFQYDPTALNSRVQIFKGSSFGNITNFNTTLLQDNHWYKAKLVLDKSPTASDEIMASVLIEDYGTSGTQTPTIIAQKTNVSISSVLELKSASDMQFIIEGRARKGISHLDNLNISPVAPNAVADISKTINDIKLYPTLANSSINIILPETVNPLEIEAKLIDFSGRNLENIQFDNFQKNVNISSYANGSYFISFYSKGSFIGTKKFEK